MPPPIELSLADLLSLATEFWRLSTSLGAAPPLALHSLRKMGETFTQAGLEIRNLDGLTYDPGLSARVIDRTESAVLPPGAAIISETLRPLILYKGQVVQPADILLTTGPNA